MDSHFLEPTNPAQGKFVLEFYNEFDFHIYFETKSNIKEQIVRILG